MNYFKYIIAFSISFVTMSAIPSSLNVLAKVRSVIEVPKFEQLLKINGKEFEIVHDNSVSLIPQSQYKVRKIGFGKETDVRIVRSSSGTYSSNSMFSRNVLYPGIIVKEVTKNQPEDTVIWLLNNGWEATSVKQANSFISLKNTKL